MEEQDVELIDYLRVIWKRKGLIILGTTLAAMVALVVSLYLPKTYEISRTLRIGSVQGKPIDSREAVIDYLTDERIMSALIREFQLGMRPKQMGELIDIDKKKTNPDVRYIVRAPDHVLAMRIADWLAEKITAIHGGMFEKKMEVVRRHEAELVATVRSIEPEIQRMRKSLETLSANPKVDAPAVILLQANIGDRERVLADLQRALKEVHVSLSPPDSENTKIVAADELPVRPIKPKVTLNVVLAGIVGLMLFTFVAFFLEYLERAGRKGAKREKEQ